VWHWTAQAFNYFAFSLLIPLYLTAEFGISDFQVRAVSALLQSASLQLALEALGCKSAWLLIVNCLPYITVTPVSHRASGALAGRNLLWSVGDAARCLWHPLLRSY